MDKATFIMVVEEAKLIVAMLWLYIIIRLLLIIRSGKIMKIKNNIIKTQKIKKIYVIDVICKGIGHIIVIYTNILWNFIKNCLKKYYGKSCL